jgi:hypothetical protein
MGKEIHPPRLNSAKLFVPLDQVIYHTKLFLIHLTALLCLQSNARVTVVIKKGRGGNIRGYLRKTVKTSGPRFQHCEFPWCHFARNVRYCRNLNSTFEIHEGAFDCCVGQYFENERKSVWKESKGKCFLLSRNVPHSLNRKKLTTKGFCKWIVSVTVVIILRKLSL